MNGVSTFQLFSAATYFIPGFLWLLVAQHAWRFQRTRQPSSRFFRLLPLLSTSAAAMYLVLTAGQLIPANLEGSRFALDVLADGAIFVTLATGRHTARYFPTPEERRPDVAWLAINYGLSLAMIAFAVLVRLETGEAIQSHVPYRIVRVIYQLGLLALIAWPLIRTARPQVWRGGLFMARADVLMVAGGVLIVLTWVIGITASVLLKRSNAISLVPSGASRLLDLAAGLALMAPFVVRILGEVVRGLVLALVTLTAAGGLYFGSEAARLAYRGSELELLLDVATVLALVVVLVPGQTWLRAGVDHVVFRRSRGRREELQAFLHTLSPELPGAECCRRALSQVIRVMRLRGAAILLRNGETLRQGAIAFRPLEALWQRQPNFEAFPSRPLVGYELRELPDAVIEALSQTDVVGVVPIFSPHQRWGVLLISTGLVRATFSDEDEQTLDAFADQLARVLDAADLLARTVAVERSLAHSEKLAAIGELAARMAHEIRNPVAAASSLAQQLARDPVSPLNAEHAELILTELQRVERQVAGLLRFARREEFRLESVDVSELVRTTAEQFRARCDAAGIALELDAGDGITAPLDREKIRQVVINLVENAIDALGSNTGARQLSVAVARADGAATVRVTDNGAGIAPDLLPRVFEPFFSLKPHGTGLGLAIAKRTVEAHGGRIDATSQTGKGTTFNIALPLQAGSPT